MQTMLTICSICWYPFIHLGGKRHCESVLSKNTTQCPWPGLEPGSLDPESSSLTMRPPRLPRSSIDSELRSVVAVVCLLSSQPILWADQRDAWRLELMTEKLVRLSRTNRQSKVQRDACLPNSKRLKQQRKQRQRQCRLKIVSTFKLRISREFRCIQFTFHCSSNY